MIDKLTLKGIISSVCSLDIDTWGLLSTGNIEMNIKNVNLHAHLVAVNSGRLTATNSSVAAPFLLNVQSSGAVASSDTQRVKIGGAEQDVLTVETIVFLMTASGLEGKSIINRSVLLFKFLTQTSSCIPDSDAMKAWNEAMPVLKSLQHNVSEKTLSEALAQCSSLTQSELELREACTLYIAVNKFVDDLLSNGIQSFHVGTLVEELIKANRLFHGPSLVKDRLLKIPELAKKSRNVLKYGVKSIQEYFGFGKVDIEACGKGIRESGAWSYHAGVLQTTAGYRARFDNSWRNQGLVSTSAGDVIISSSVVTSKGKCHQGLIKAANNLVLDAEKQIQIENVRARNSKLAAESATVENIHGCSLAVSALNDTKVSDANMDYIGVDSKGSASVKNSTVNETVKIKAKDKANIRNINAKNLQTESTMVDIQRYSGQNLEVRATEKASVSDSSVDYIDLNSQGSTSLTNSTIRKSARVNAAGNAAIKNVNAENLRTHASTVDIQNHAGNSLEVLASNRANISGSSVDFIDVDSHGDASLTGSSIRVAGIRAAGNAKISNVFSENLLATAATVSVQRLQGENMEVAAKDHVTVTNSSVENAYIKSEKGSASVRDSVFKKTASIFGSRKAEAGNVQGGTISVRAENGIAKTSGKVEANTLELKGDTVKLDNNGTVVHNVGTLRIDTKRIAEISDMIQSKGMYEKMNIRDKLDLAVSDQSILLSDDVICKAALHLRAKAIDIGNATVDSAKGINLEATAGNLSLKHSKLKSDKSIQLKSSKKSINIHASSINAGENISINAKNDVNISAEEIKHTKVKKKGNCFTKRRIVETWSEVKGSNFKASNEISIIAEEGKVASTACKFQSQGDLTVKAKKSVEFKSLVTSRSRKVQKSSFFGLFGSSCQNEDQEIQDSSLVVRGQLNVTSLEGDIDITGVTGTVKEGASFSAEKGTVRFSDEILKISKESKKHGFAFSEGFLGYSSAASSNSTSLLAGSKLIARSLNVKSKNFIVDKGYGLAISEDADIIADNVVFKGAALKSKATSNEKRIGINFEDACLECHGERSSEDVTEYANQVTSIGGKLRIHAKNLNLDAANLTAEEISGTVDKMTIQSRQKKVNKRSNSWTVGLSATTVAGIPIPYPSKFKYSKSAQDSKFVEKVASLNIKRGILSTDFKTGKLSLIGASVTSDGNIESFAEDVQSRDIKNVSKASSSGCKLGVNIAARSANISTKTEEHAMQNTVKATVGSRQGRVASIFQRTLNTDIDKQTSEVEKSSDVQGFAFGLSKKGGEFGIESNSFQLGFKAGQKGIGGNLRVENKAVEIEASRRGFNTRLESDDVNLAFGASKKGIDAQVKTKDGEFAVKAGKKGVLANIGTDDKQIGFTVGKHEIAGNIRHGELGAGLKAGKDSLMLNVKAGESSIEFAKDKKGLVAVGKHGNISARVKKTDEGVGIHAQNQDTSIALHLNDGGLGFDAKHGETAIGLVSSQSGVKITGKHNNTSFGVETNKDGMKFAGKHKDAMLGVESHKHGMKFAGKHKDTSFGVESNEEGLKAAGKHKDTSFGFESHKNGMKFAGKHKDTMFGVKSSKKGLTVAGQHKDALLGVQSNKDGITVAAQHNDASFGVESSKDGMKIAGKHKDTVVGVESNKDGMKVAAKHKDTVLGVESNKEGLKVAGKHKDSSFGFESQKNGMKFAGKHEDTMFGVESSKKGLTVAGQHKDTLLRVQSNKDGITVAAQHKETSFGVESNKDGMKIAGKHKDTVVGIESNKDGMKVAGKHKDTVLGVESNKEQLKVAGKHHKDSSFGFESHKNGMKFAGKHKDTVFGVESSKKGLTVAGQHKDTLLGVQSNKDGITVAAPHKDASFGSESNKDGI